MTPEQLDEARAKEAVREADEADRYFTHFEIATLAARKARENWTPPEPVDPDLLAFREFASKAARSASLAESYRDGDMDSCASAYLFLAGARMAREQERARSKTLGEGVRPLFLRLLELAAINDFDETVADGGITSGMVCRQEITLIADALILLFSENDKADQ